MHELEIKKAILNTQKLVWHNIKTYVFWQDSPHIIAILHIRHEYNVICWKGQRLAGGSIKKGNGDLDLQDYGKKFWWNNVGIYMVNS